ncbi:hypothetical protein [Dyella lutea]|uniref:Uncharacterized protein n=1 Tax=Dyella lutea TaxID=2950441 RepID=A0ABT1FF30_9GAMM|nr:hypothetical protein [Dyella lutea]MCP1375997.1 hypothetical protein [Dyella lutea]
MPYMTVEVHIDDDDILDCLDDMSDQELQELGYCRIGARSGDTPGAMRGTNVWHEVRLAMRQRDERRMADLLSQLAWDQAGVILPDGLPPVH